MALKEKMDMSIGLLNKLTLLKITFRSLRYRNFRLFFAGQTISLIGTWIQRIATPWLVYHLTDSAFILGFIGFIGQLPTFLFAPLAGVITDSCNRYRILIVTQLLAMLQALTLALLYLTGKIAVWHVAILSVFLGCINALDTPARQSLVVEMIDNKDDLSNAIALNSSMVNGARLLGPSIAGVLIATMGEGICFLLNGISYIFVIVSLLMMRMMGPSTTKQMVSGKVLTDLKEGIKYTFGFAPIRAVILLLALISLVGMPYSILMPIFARDILNGSSHTFGFLMGASGIGALIAALYLASRKSVLGRGKVIPLAASVFGVGLILFSLSRVFIISLILMLIVGLGMMLQLASSNTILQTIVDDDKRGRVMSFYTMAFMGTAPFGSLLAGISSSFIGAPNTLIIGGVLCVGGGIIFFRKLQELRKMIRPIYIKKGIITSGISVSES
ncbi:MAG: MFS transporter [Ignavibacteria bacterium]